MQLSRLETVSVLCPLLFLSCSLFFSLFFRLSLPLKAIFRNCSVANKSSHTHALSLIHIRTHTYIYRHKHLCNSAVGFFLIITNTVNYQLNEKRFYRFWLFSAICFRELQHVMTSNGLFSAVYVIIRDILRLSFFGITATCVINIGSE